MDLSGSDLDRRALSAVLRSFPRLKKIKAKGAAFTGVILSLHAPVLSLESLDISNCGLDGGDDIDDELVEQGESLEEAKEADDARHTGHGIISSLLHVIQPPSLLELYCVNSFLGLSDGVLHKVRCNLLGHLSHSFLPCSSRCIRDYTR